jgi:hypothetical protein
VPRLPSSQNVPQISPEVTRDPGVQIPNRALDSTLSIASQEIAPAIDRYAQIALKQEDRNDTIDRADLIETHDKELDNKLLELNTQKDLSKPDVLGEYGSFMAQRRQELLDSHKGSADSRALLELRLKEIGSKHTGRAAGISAKIGKEKIGKRFNSSLVPLVSRASQEPRKENIDALFLDLEAQIDDLRGGLDPAEEESLRAAGREQIASSALDTLITRGHVETAASLLDDGGLVQSFSTDKARDLRRKIEIVRYERDEVTRKIAQAEAFMGRPLTPDQRAQAGLGMLGLTGKSEELIEVGDLSSPTGTRFVPKSQAAGQPGKPTVPSGFRMVRDPSDPSSVRLQPIPGGPEDTKRQERARQQTEQARLTARQSKLVIRDVDRALKLIDDSIIPAAGASAAASRYMPGTPAFNLDLQIDSIRARIGFDQLQNMRAASPTGGALGPVSDRENTLLQSVMGSLDIRQDTDILKENFKQIREIYLDAWFGTPEEHQAAIEDGRMTPEQVKKLQHERETVGFDAIGRALDPDGQERIEKGKKSGKPEETDKSKTTKKQPLLLEPEDILAMSRNELLRLDKEIDAFDAAQKAALDKRLTELGL